MDDFARVTALERLDEQRFRARIADGWQQGRGAFGGVVLGMLARAACTVEPDRALRTLSGDVCGPVLVGEVEILTRVLRRGSNQTNLLAELRQNGDVLAVATTLLSAARPSLALPLLDAPPAETAIGWRDVPIVPLGPPVAAAFTVNYEYRSRTPGFVQTGEPRLSGFIRERSPLPRVDSPALIARLDAWWPSLFSASPLRPMATVSFTAELLVDPASLPPDEPLAYRARMAGLHDGFFVELRELWRGEELIALNQQTFAIIK